MAVRACAGTVIGAIFGCGALFGCADSCSCCDPAAFAFAALAFSKERYVCQPMAITPTPRRSVSPCTLDSLLCENRRGSEGKRSNQTVYYSPAKTLLNSKGI